LDETHIEIWRGCVELHAVLRVLVVVSVVELVESETVGLIEISGSHCILLIGEDLHSAWERGPEVETVGTWVGHLQHVGTIGSISSFTLEVLRICIATCPLDVHVVGWTEVETVWGVVVLCGWEDLDDVTSLSSDVEVEDAGGGGDS